MRRPGDVGAFQAVSTWLSGTGAGLAVSVPAVISAARAGSMGGLVPIVR